MFSTIKVEQLISLNLKCKHLNPTASINQIVQFIQECAMRRGHLTTLFNSNHQSNLLEKRLNASIDLKQRCCNTILENQSQFESVIDKVPHDLFHMFMFCAIYKLKVDAIKVSI